MTSKKWNNNILYAQNVKMIGCKQYNGICHSLTPCNGAYHNKGKQHLAVHLHPNEFL